MATLDGRGHPEGIFSLLDTDLYKLTMQCAILKFYPNVHVRYQFTNRTSQMKLNKRACTWLQEQINRLENLVVTDEEIQWLKKTCPYLSDSYLQFLQGFRLRPKEQVQLSFKPATPGQVTDASAGDIDLSIHGIWTETILYEIPLLALTSEAYFKFVDTDWNHDDQMAKAKSKGERLLEAGCTFSEFGSRRRRDYQTHELVIRGLMEAQKEAETNGKGWQGRLSGTSNVHLAMRFGLSPVGTVAHEWFMGIAAITQDYANANELAMQYWIETFGRGVLGIALTDTFGTPAFLRAFARPVPRESGSGAVEWEEHSYAQVFTGVRQDSGDPLKFVQLMRTFYNTQAIKEEKVVVFSDSLDIDRCIQYKDAAEKSHLTPAFGVGTFFTNDFSRLTTTGKSVPLNIVIKLSKANGRDAIKLSDDKGKNMGNDNLMRSVKEKVGYAEHTSKFDEGHRWDGNGA